MYGSWDKAGHYFSDVRRSIDALYFAYFITRYLGPSSLWAPPPSFRAPWASLYELTAKLGGVREEDAKDEDKGKKSRMRENSREIRENNGEKER